MTLKPARHRRWAAAFLEIGSAAFLLFALLFVGYGWRSSAGGIGSIFKEISAVVWQEETQWMVFLCLGIYFATFVILQFKLKAACCTSRLSLRYSPVIWLAGVMILSTICYVSSLPALILLLGATIGYGMALWARVKVRNQNSEASISVAQVMLAVLTILLALASAWDEDFGVSYIYRSCPRRTGPWDNPNLFGLLMGTGFVLAISGMMQTVREKVQGVQLDYLRWCKIAFLLAVGGLLGRGLLNSYSRGAWLATVCGLTYLVCFWLWRFSSWCHKGTSTNHNSEICNISWLKKNWLVLAIILAVLGVICYWHFQHTGFHPARRALSVVNSADFSSRNRIAAWVADLQITAEHPWFGAGWNQPELLYEHYYLPPRLTESAAIQMNDYLMLGATLGIPALFCFAMYLGLSLMQNEKFKIENAGDETTGDAQCRVAAEVTRLKLKPENRNEIADNTAGADRQCSDCNSQKPPLDATQEPRLASVESVPPTVGIPRFSQSLLTSTATKMGPVMRLPPSSNFLAATCRAGAIVLLVGFWFDGGLFKLPTATTFWILLELGSMQAQMNTNERTANK